MQEVQSCGQGAFFLVFLGIAGFVASFLAIILASIRARNARHVAVAAVFLGGLTVVYSIGAARRLDESTRIALERRPPHVPASAGHDPNVPAEGPHIDPAKGCVILGAQAGSMPILAGIGAFLWALKSRRRNAEPDLP